MNDLIFVGFNSRVAALDRLTGVLRWDWKTSRSRGYVTLLLDGDRLIVSVNGYTYCLDPATGEELWFNPLAGMGTGVPSLAGARGGSAAHPLLAVAEEEINAANSASTSY